jgi:hypothetical protein
MTASTLPFLAQQGWAVADGPDSNRGRAWSSNGGATMTSLWPLDGQCVANTLCPLTPLGGSRLDLPYGKPGNVRGNGVASLFWLLRTVRSRPDLSVGGSELSGNVVAAELAHR